MPVKISSRDKILSSARELFYRGGYQMTSVDEILAHCGVAKSNFYYHFKTKEDLAFAVLDIRIAEYEAWIAQTLNHPTLEPGDRLHRFFRALGQPHGETTPASGCPFGNFAAALPTTEAGVAYERFRHRLCQLFRLVETAFQNCLEEGVRTGTFRADISPEEMAAFMVATLQGLLILSKTYRDVSPLIKGLAVVERLLQPPNK